MCDGKRGNWFMVFRALSEKLLVLCFYLEPGGLAVSWKAIILCRPTLDLSTQDATFFYAFTWLIP